MNCVELQKSLAEIEDGNAAAQQAHLRICPECSALVTELNLIASSGIELREANEPSPRLWNAIETALRQEGLIRAPRANCVELQQSLAEIGDGSSAAQRAHLKTCPECSALVMELSLIASAAGDLREADEPGPRVWNSIEIGLRQEGLIRPQRTGRSLLPSISSRWAWARWMAPAAAAVLVAVGMYVYQQSPTQPVAQNLTRPANPAADVAAAGLNDDDLLQEVAQQTPAMQAQYADNLRRVNEYIQDAKNDVAFDPNDEEARRSLLEAYQEKAMLFELAMDRSLP